MTTKLLESVFHKAASLPAEVQDSLARQWLAELEDEGKWDQAFAKTGEIIDRMAEQAIREHHQGKTTPKGIDEL